ncbi:ASCH domain-containing protein [Pusillimonas noertemannii]|uniref:ASCH domain-containing protein n=1 Tax=Pusillimonas noertemannii TaxID=305977 RepID=A0A2U1CML1_9BURK|nr:ASCH domain-containing protein [Pusillimonas noertemannii]NYT68747.1 ASCH domain-containing protein [Pusillimonas noertemannii]PVY62233.1 ASCH domain-containing protein [Pusillimonas noertemannii]TFL10788.1 ASCH domain-containing protein [Pusillimonas noertemannii]
MKALSIRQPWAWLIVHGHKPIENRSWRTTYRGPLLIHAAQGMTRAEYEDARDLAEQLGITIPAFDALERGGIVGQATVTGCVDDSESPWFFGKYGFELADAKPLPFTPMRGRLSIFEAPGSAPTHGMETNG